MNPDIHSNIPGWGVDADFSARPGVPMELHPEIRGGAHWDEVERQPPPSVRVLKRKELPELTPVFSQAYPPKGLSGVLRRWAYARKETLTRHWLLLLVADRVDVLEHRLRSPAGLAALGLAGAGVGWALLRGRRPRRSRRWRGSWQRG